MGYLSKAKRHLELAQQEFSKADGDEDRIRQSAEKGWLAVVLATNHLFQKRGIKVPRGSRKREDILFDLEEKDNKIRELRLAERYRHLMLSLHIECFYDGDVSLKRVGRDFNKAKEYIDTTEKV